MPLRHFRTYLAMFACLALCLSVAFFWFAQLLRADPPAAAAAGTAAGAASGAAPGAESEPGILVINKTRPLAQDYVPDDLTDAGGVLLRSEAAGAYLQMSTDAAAAGVYLSAVSGFRSAQEQAGLYDSYSDRYGQQAAETISARPGYSEHQTGLAIDVGNPDGVCALEACFAETTAGSWAAANAHHHGFIIRYPAGAESITGYAYEPWHLRYVGQEYARQIVDAGLTLEEFTGLPPAPGY